MPSPTTFCTPPASPLCPVSPCLHSSSLPSTPSSPRSRSQSPLPGMHLSFPGAARLLVKLRRLRHPRPCIHLQSSSGPGPQTDWSLADELADEPNAGSVSEGGHGMAKAAVSRRCIPLVKEYTFVCRDGVDTARLLRLVRAEMLEQAKTLGGSVLVDEQWSCTICGPRDDGRTFKVHIRYAASAARSARPDPQSPVAIEHAKGIPGLMTILDREECF